MVDYLKAFETLPELWKDQVSFKLHVNTFQLDYPNRKTDLFLLKNLKKSNSDHIEEYHFKHILQHNFELELATCFLKNHKNCYAHMGN